MTIRRAASWSRSLWDVPLLLASCIPIVQALKRGPAPQRLWSEPIQGLSLHHLTRGRGLLIPSSPSSNSPSVVLIEPTTGHILSTLGFASPGPVGITMHTSTEGSETAYIVDTLALIAVDVGTMTVSWVFKAPDGALLDLAPAVDPEGKLVYVGDNSVPQATLYAIRPPTFAAVDQEGVGEVVWNVTIPAGLAAPPLGVEGGVVIQANTGTYRFLSRTDGHTIWAKNFGYPTALAPILRSDGEALLVKVGIEGELQALSLDTGSALWDQSAIHVMRASDSTNTTFLTEKRVTGKRSTYNALPLTLASIKVRVTGKRSTYNALPLTLASIKSERSGVVLLAVTGLGQYVGPNDGQHGQIKAAVAAHQDSTGEELWRVLLPEPTMVPLTPPLLNKRGTIVFIATSDQHIYGLDSKSGRMLWEEDVDDGPLVHMAYVDHGDEEEELGGTLFYLTLEKAHAIQVPPGLQGEEDRPLKTA